MVYNDGVLYFLDLVFKYLPLPTPPMGRALCILVVESLLSYFIFFFRFCDEGTCTDKANILYAWARNAPPTRLPKGIPEASWMVLY